MLRWIPWYGRLREKCGRPRWRNARVVVPTLRRVLRRPALAKQLGLLSSFSSADNSSPSQASSAKGNSKQQASPQKKNPSDIPPPRQTLPNPRQPPPLRLHLQLLLQRRLAPQPFLQPPILLRNRQRREQRRAVLLPRHRRVFDSVGDDGGGFGRGEGSEEGGWVPTPVIRGVRRGREGGGTDRTSRHRRGWI